MTTVYLQVNGGVGSGWKTLYSNATVGATPPTGYVFHYWSSNYPAEVANVYAQWTTVHMVTTNMYVTANFTRVLYSVSYHASGGGSISGTTPQFEYYGNYLTQVSAVAAPGYHFTRWSDGLLTNTRRDTCLGNASYTAYFEQNAPVVPTEGNHGSGYITII